MSTRGSTRAMHMHDDRVEIRLIRRGNGIHIIDGRTYATQAGDILIFHPYVLHDECADQMAGLEILGCSIGNIRIKTGNQTIFFRMIVLRLSEAGGVRRKPKPCCL